jgi:hypothetical protein
LVEISKRFWDRYPDRYKCPKGIPIFHASGSLSVDHDKWISDDYFELVGSVNRFPRYKNKRMIDPQVKLFLDEHGLEIDPGWGLPIPNQEAAYKSLAKYGKATVIMSDEDVGALNEAWQYMSNHFYPYMCNSEVVSLDEALKRVDRSTSSGYPFNQEFSKKGDLFDNDPEIISWLEGDWKLLARDPEWTTIFSSSLKEELRTDQKIEENSIRTFAAGAVDATIHGTRLFVDQNEKMYASHLKSASAVGMSPLKGNWNRLFMKLSVFSNGYALDESQYDSSLRAFLMWGCARFRWQCLREVDRTLENLQRIKTYYRNLVNTLLLTPEGILLLKKLGNPSGSVNTVTDNTLILYWLLAYAWIKTAPKDLRTHADFELHTAKALLGDDNTWTVSDLAHIFYNGRSVIEMWKILGITTTTDSLDARLPEDLDFLSAHTVFLNGKAVPLYDRNKLMKSLLYAPKEHLTPETTLTRVTCLLQIGWTDLAFRRFCRDIIQFLLEEYDDVLKEDERWIIAKTNIKTDDFYYQLFTGNKLLRPQCYDMCNKCCGHDEDTYCMCDCICSEALERLEMPDKAPIMSAQQQSQKKKSRRNQRRRGPQRAGKKAGRKGISNAALIANYNAIAARNRPRRRGRRGRGINGPRGVEGVGIMAGGVLTNTRTHSAPEIREGEELISTVSGSTGYATTQFNINPANATTFPWLSKIAQLFERYEFEALSFHFGHDVSGFATQGQTGLVYLSALYDAASAAPTSVTQIEATDPFVPCMPNENSCCRLDKKSMHPSNEPKYCLQGNPPGGTDIKTYNAGSLFVSTSGMANTTEIGKLRVKYRVRLFDRILDATPAAAPANFVVSEFISTGSEGLVTATPFQPLLSTTVTNGVSGVNTAGSIVLPAGNYVIYFEGVYAYTGSSTNTSLQLNKNAVLVGNAKFEAHTAATLTSLVLEGTRFVTSNGTDAFALNTTATFSTGTALVVANMIITAV